jgi:hypothetical protein
LGEVLAFPDPVDAPRVEAFRREGLGYVYEPPGQQVRMRADFLKRRGEELHGVLTVETTMPGTPPHLHEATQNFSSLTARTTLARALQERADNVPWRDLVEQFCVGVMRREREGTPFVDLSEVAEKPREPDHVERIVPWRAATWLYGEGGSCKGLIATAIAVCVATGREFLGMRVRQANVAYLDWEDDHDEMIYRISIICRGMGIDRPKFYWRSCKRNGPLKNQTNHIANEFAELGIGFYVIDSVGLAAGLGSERGGPEESTLSLFEAMGYLEATPLCIDHISKEGLNSKGAHPRAYGSIYKENLCRQAWEVRKDQEDGSSEAHIGLFNHKSNRGAKLPPIGIRANWFSDEAEPAVLLHSEDVRASSTLVQAGGLTMRIEHVLRHGSLTVREISDELDERPDKVRATLNQSKRFQKLGDRWGLVQSA